MLAHAGGTVSEGEQVSIKDLVNNMADFDGKLVTIEGEVVGDILNRGEYAWITVNDDPYSVKSLEEGGDFAGISNVGIGVWIPREEAQKLSYLGGYKNKGDQVRIKGTFHRACHEHGGDTDIHASFLEVVERGHPISHPFQYGKLLVVVILSMVIVILWYVRRQKIRMAYRRERSE
jgi:hypothetical protein